jgi:hypothetical protein
MLYTIHPIEMCIAISSSCDIEQSNDNDSCCHQCGWAEQRNTARHEGSKVSYLQLISELELGLKGDSDLRLLLESQCLMCCRAYEMS